MKCNLPSTVTWMFNYGRIPENAYAIQKILTVTRAIKINEGVYSCATERTKYVHILEEASLKIYGNQRSIAP